MKNVHQTLWNWHTRASRSRVLGFPYRLIRLPLEFIFLIWDAGKVCALVVRRLASRLLRLQGEPPGCSFCEDHHHVKHGRRRCFAARKYANLWLFRCVCPCVRSPDPAHPDEPYCSLTSEYDFRLSYVPLTLAVIALGFAGSAFVTWRTLAPPYRADPIAQGPTTDPASEPDMDPGKVTHPPTKPEVTHVDNAQEALERAEAFYAEGDYESAKIYFQLARVKSDSDPEIFFRLGETLMALKQPHQAGDAFVAAAQLAPDNLPYRMAVAETMDVLFKPQEALKHARAAERIDPDNVKVLCQLARYCATTLRYDEATRYADRALATAGDDPNILAGIGLVYGRMGNSKQAEALYERALSRHPDHLESAKALLRIQLNQQRFAEAAPRIATLKKRAPEDLEVRLAEAELTLLWRSQKEGFAMFEALIQEDAERVMTRVHFAELLLRIGQASEAKVRAEQLLYSRNAPTAVRAHMVLARVYHQSGLYHDAHKQAAAALGINPHHTTALRFASDALVKLERYQEATIPLRKLQNAHPEELILSLQLARCHRSLGDDAAAEARYEEARLHHPNSPLIGLERADGMMHQGRFDEARSLYREIIESSPDFPPAINNLATLLVEHPVKDEDLAEGLMLSTRLVESKPDSGLCADTHGWTLIRNGQVAEGLSWLEKARQLNYQSPALAYHLGAAYSELKQYEKAEDFLEKALAQSDTFMGHERARQLLDELKKNP